MPGDRSLFDDMVDIAEHVLRTGGACSDETFQRFHIPGVFILAYGERARRAALDRATLRTGLGLGCAGALVVADGDDFRPSERPA